MQYFLVPGHVYPRSQPPGPFLSAFKKVLHASTIVARSFSARGREANRRRKPQQISHGFSILSVCKQIHAEGVRMFYERNTFHLPPGPVDEAFKTLTLLQQQHLRMIKSIWITVTPDDLTPTLINTIHAKSRGDPNRDIPPWSDRDIVEALWREIWSTKTSALATNYPWLETIYLNNGAGRYKKVHLGVIPPVWKGAVLRKNWRQLQRRHVDRLHTVLILTGWEKTRKVLLKRAKRRMWHEEADVVGEGEG